jgi:ribosomal protein L40E
MAPKLYDSMDQLMAEKICTECGGQYWGLIDPQTIYCRRCHPEYDK